jgi:hypothetical protein
MEFVRDRKSLESSAWWRWEETWRNSPEGLAYRRESRSWQTQPAADGTFRFDDIPAGVYRLTASFSIKNQRRPLAHAIRAVTVTPAAGDRSDDATDVGELALDAPAKPFAPGEEAPSFAGKSTDGREIRLEDYRGRFLLLDLGALWDEQSRYQVAWLDEAYQVFGADGRIAFLSVIFAPDTPGARRFVTDKRQAWPQVLAGSLSNPISKAYRADMPIPNRRPTTAILIGPDGRIIGDLGYGELTEKIETTLTKSGLRLRPKP